MSQQHQLIPQRLGRYLAKTSSHQKISPDLDSGNQRIQSSHTAQPPVKAANAPHRISPQVMNTHFSYLIIIHFSDFSKRAGVHFAQLMLGQSLWTGFQGDHPAICGLPKYIFKKKQKSVMPILSIHCPLS